MKKISSKPVGISVIVCCYNSQERLPETIKHLALQYVPKEIDWEIIIVNNASSDSTKEVAWQQWNIYNSQTAFRVVGQPKPGLSAARIKGIETARYEYLLFCDDDNWLQSDYVANAFEIMHANKKIGALGGVGKPAFEIAPPKWYDKRKEIMYALGEQGKQNGDITDTKGYVYGAGMVVRFSAIDHIKKSGFVPTVTDRYKNKLSASGDSEICYALRLAGYRIWYNESLKFKHFIPKERLKWKYYLRLKEMGIMSGVFLNPYLDILEENGAPPSKWKWLKEIIDSALEIASMWKFYRRYLFFNESYPHLYAHYRGLVGRIKGWFSFRSRHAEVYIELVKIEEKAKQLKCMDQAKSEYYNKNKVRDNVQIAPEIG